MLIELLVDLVKLAFFVAGAYLVLQAYVRRRQPDWVAHLTQRRLAVLGALTLAMSAIKVIEDVVAKESGPVDTALLWFVRDHVPAALTGLFGLVTLSGSAAFLLPASVTAVVALLFARRHFEALLMGASMVTASLLVYGLKAIVGRARPALWESQWYWGSSFPSGHTLSTAAFATAAAVAAQRQPGDGGGLFLDGPGGALAPRTWRALAVGCPGRAVPGRLHSAVVQCGVRRLFAVRAVVANRSLSYGSAQIVQVESDNDAA